MRKISKMRSSDVFAGLVILAVSSPILQGESFTFTTVTYPGAESTEVQGINDAGQVLGFGKLDSDTYQTFLYGAGEFTPVTLPGMPDSLPVALNNRGAILAYSGNTVYVLNNGTATPVAAPDYRLYSGGGINDLGQIVGTSEGQSSGPMGYLIDGSKVEILNRGSIQTYANAINNRGQIVGYSQIDGTIEGFLYQGGTYQTIAVPGASFTYATGINDLGEIVGDYGDSELNLHGFVDIGGAFSTFNGPPDFYPWNPVVNNLGQIAGTWETNSPGIGYTGFIGTPVQPAPTPEPGTIGLVGTGLAALAGAAFRRVRSA